MRQSIVCTHFFTIKPFVPICHSFAVCVQRGHLSGRVTAKFLMVRSNILMCLFVAVGLTRRLKSDGNTKGTTTLRTQRKTVTLQVTDVQDFHSLIRKQT